MTDTLPSRIAWFAPWRWFANWKPWQRWTLIASVALISYVLSGVPVTRIANRFGGAKVENQIVQTVYLPLVWMESHSPAARQLFRMEQDWVTALLGEP